MNRNATFLGGLALGAGLMYILDPERGTRRRARMRDQAGRLAHRSRDFLGKASRDLQHRAQGLAAHARHRFSNGHTPDEVLMERVRSRMGRYVSHPRAIDVTSDGGEVTVRGPILLEETTRFLQAIAALPGVKSVIDQLDKHDRSEGVPALQGGSTAVGELPELQQKNWSPAIQLLTGLTAIAALLFGTRLVHQAREGIDRQLAGMDN